MRSLNAPGASLVLVESRIDHCPHGQVQMEIGQFTSLPRFGAVALTAEIPHFLHFFADPAHCVPLAFIDVKVTHLKLSLFDKESDDLSPYVISRGHTLG